MDKSVEKENVTYIGRHRNTRRIKRVSKQILTNIASQFFIAISVPLNIYAAECELFGVRIAGDDSWKFRTCLDHLRWGSEAIPFKIVNDVSFYSLQSALASAFTHRNVNSFISHRTWWFVWLRSAIYYYNERSSSIKSQCQRRVFEDNNIKYWPTPAESPDMNPLKLPWHELKTFSCVALSSQLTRTNLSRASIGSGTLGLLLSAVNTLATSEKLLLL